MSARHTVGARLVHWLTAAAEFPLTRLPLPWAIRIAEAMGRVVGILLPLRRRVALANLAAAFPEKPPRERRRILRRAYVNHARALVEIVNLPRLSRVCAQRVTEEHPDRVNHLCAEHGGFIVVTGHVGSWEVGGALNAQRGLRLTAIAKPLHNGYLNDHIRRQREQAGIEILFTGSDLSHAIGERLRAGRIVIFLADQDARQFGVFVDFFGRPASTPRGAALWALRTGKPILPVFTLCEPGLRHRVIYGEPIHPPPAAADHNQAIREITQAFTRQLEAIVRRAPDQYFWFHRRWKTQPHMLKPKHLRRAGLAAANPRAD